MVTDSAVCVSLSGQCKYDFCWICLEGWKKHSSSTGGSYRCTRYEVILQLEKQSREMTEEVIIMVLIILIIMTADLFSSFISERSSF